MWGERGIFIYTNETEEASCMDGSSPEYPLRIVLDFKRIGNVFTLWMTSHQKKGKVSRYPCKSITSKTFLKLPNTPIYSHSEDI
jgi:hypothetical protein